jgi:transposase
MLRELNVVEQRYRAVLEVLSGTPVIEVAERYGVARQTVHRWMARYQAESLDGLADRSHLRRQHPWRIPAETEALICELRGAHPRWGPRRLVFEMDRCGYPGLSRSTVYRVHGGDAGQARAVCSAFVEAMREYGVPAEVLSDNGKQFTGRFGKPRPAEVLFERICRENGITHPADQAQIANDHGEDRAPAPDPAAGGAE